MAQVRVDIADIKTAVGEDAELVARGLGSCIGLAVFDPVAHAGGILHYMLPEASIDPEKARESPCMFGDTGIPLLFREAYKVGAQRARLQIKIVGGANVLDRSGLFDIGKRNYLLARRILSKNNLQVASELVGGVTGKTMRLFLSDGRIEVSLPGGETRVI